MDFCSIEGSCNLLQEHGVLNDVLKGRTNRDFWADSGFRLLQVNPAGQLVVTDDFLRYPSWGTTTPIFIGSATVCLIW